MSFATNRAGQASQNSWVQKLVSFLAGPFRYGALEIVLPSGGVVEIGDGAPVCRMDIHSWKLLPRVATRWDIGLAESYARGEWSSPHLADLLTLLCRNEPPNGRSPFSEFAAPLARMQHWFHANTRAGSRRNVSAHYDLGNDFYGAWLDPEMFYSSALYDSDVMSLDEAQRRKAGRIAELLDVSKHNTVLEIGCGWGGLARYLARERSCYTTAITLSREQLAYARARDTTGFNIYLMQDYRDTIGSFDRIVSVEMLEAVGEAYWPLFFEVLRDRLKIGGIAVVQAITIAEERFETYRRRPDFIQRYVFPGGMLPTKSSIVEIAKHYGLTLTHREDFGSSYTRTLADWESRFKNAWPRIERFGFDLRFKLIWEYYIAYCQAGFNAGATDVSFFKFTAR